MSRRCNIKAAAGHRVRISKINISSTTMIQLPAELVLHVLELLPVIALQRVGLVCKQLREYARCLIPARHVTFDYECLQDLWRRPGRHDSLVPPRFAEEVTRLDLCPSLLRRGLSCRDLDTTEKPTDMDLAHALTLMAMPAIETVSRAVSKNVVRLFFVLPTPPEVSHTLISSLLLSTSWGALRHLSLSSCPTEKHSLLDIKPSPRLLKSTMRLLGTHLPYLTSLKLTDLLPPLCAPSDQDLHHLTSLEIAWTKDHCDHLDPSHFKFLAHSLVSLSLPSPVSLQHFLPNSVLQSLHLTRTNWPDDSTCAHLATLTSLTRLSHSVTSLHASPWLDEHHFFEEPLRWLLHSWPQLRVLHLHAKRCCLHSVITRQSDSLNMYEDTVAALARSCPHLTHLSCHSLSPDPATILPCLTSLRLAYLDATDFNLASLCPALTHLSVAYTHSPRSYCTLHPPRLFSSELVADGTNVVQRVCGVATLRSINVPPELLLLPGACTAMQGVTQVCLDWSGWVLDNQTVLEAEPLGDILLALPGLTTLGLHASEWHGAHSSVVPRLLRCMASSRLTHVALGNAGKWTKRAMIDMFGISSLNQVTLVACEGVTQAGLAVLASGRQMEFVRLVWCVGVTRGVCLEVQSLSGHCNVVQCNGPIPWSEGEEGMEVESGWRNGADEKSE